MEYVLDSENNLWEYYPAVDRWYRLPDKAHSGLTLDQVHEKYGPLRNVVIGSTVEPPYKPIAPGTWVTVEADDLAELAGRVKSYDKEKFYYEIIVTFPRSGVIESI